MANQYGNLGSIAEQRVNRRSTAALDALAGPLRKVGATTMEKEAQALLDNLGAAPRVMKDGRPRRHHGVGFRTWHFGIQLPPPRPRTRRRVFSALWEVFAAPGARDLLNRGTGPSSVRVLVRRPKIART